MQNLDVISVNLWSIIASLGNLVLLYLLAKKFLYKPVKKVLEERRRTIDESYLAADEAKRNALGMKEQYETMLEQAEGKADEIVSLALQDAKCCEKDIVTEARQEADRILERASLAAEMERKKAEESIREEIISVSTQLSEKILEREIREEDHRILIDRFIRDLGEDHE